MTAPDRRIALFGAPVEIGASRRGTLMGPAALRTAGLPSVLEALGWGVEDHDDLLARDIRPATEPGPPEALARFYPAIAAWTRAISARAYELARGGATLMTLGGDHSLSMGSVNGVARHWREQGRKLFVLWLDAHADYNTPATTETGNMHGMSAAFLCGEGGLDQLLGDEPRASLPPERLCIFGLRSVDPAEGDLLKLRGVEVVDMRAIDEFGVAEPLRRFLQRVEAEDGVLHVSFDIDFVDPTTAPGTGTTVPGGATYREAHLAMELLHDCGRVRSVDVVELNPFLDNRGATARMAVELVGSLFGRRIVDRPTPTNAL